MIVSVSRSAIFPALFLTLLCTTSCEKDDKEQPGYRIHISTPLNAASEITDVKTGWLHNYRLCNDIASAKYKRGGFDIYLPNTVADEYLNNISADMDLEGATGVVSDPDVKWRLISCFRGYSGNMGLSSTLSCSTSSIQHWWDYTGVKVCFVYVDRDVELDGSAEMYSLGAYHWDDVKLKKGWNSVAYRCESTMQYYFTPYNSDATGAEWIWETWF